MTITLNDKQIEWIGDRIREAKAEATKKLEAGIHNIIEAREAVEYDDFLNQLAEDIGTYETSKSNINLVNTVTVTPDENIKVEAKISDFKVPEDKPEDIGAPVIPEVENPKKDEAQEEMEKAKEEVMGIDPFSDL